MHADEADHSRGIVSRGIESRGTDIRGTGNTAVRTLEQEEPYASRPGPLMSMLQKLRLHLTVDSLIIRSTDFDVTLTDLYNEAHFGGNAKVAHVKSWRDVIKTLSEYLVINRLVFLIDTNPGEFLFNRIPTIPTRDPFGPIRGPHFFRDSKLFDKAAEELNALSVKPKIKTVDLDSCKAGKDIDKVRKLGLALEAEEIIATNYWHEFVARPFRADRGEQKKLEEELQNFAGYVTSPHTKGYVELNRTKPVNRVFLLEWYVETAALDTLNLPDDKKKRKGFETPESARPEIVQNSAALAALQRELYTTHQFIRYTIKLETFRRSNIPSKAAK